jgi:hypothetical protein
MKIAIHEAELAFVEALYDATNLGHITWAILPDDERDIYQSEIDGEVLQIEFMYFPLATGDCAERVIATVSGMKTYFQVAVGTPAYHMLKHMLSLEQARDHSIHNLTRATSRIQTITEDRRQSRD